LVVLAGLRSFDLICPHFAISRSDDSWNESLLIQRTKSMQISHDGKEKELFYDWNISFVKNDRALLHRCKNEPWTKYTHYILPNLREQVHSRWFARFWFAPTFLWKKASKLASLFGVRLILAATIEMIATDAQQKKRLLKKANEVNGVCLA